MVHMSTFWSFFCTFLYITNDITRAARASPRGGSRNTRVLVLDDFSSAELQTVEGRLRSTDPLFPFTRKPDRFNEMTQPTPVNPPPTSYEKQNQFRPLQLLQQVSRPGAFITQAWTNLWGQRPVVATSGQVPIIQSDNLVPVAVSAPLPANMTINETSVPPPNSEVQCVCVSTASDCQLDFILDPATKESALVRRLSQQRGWEIPQCQNNNLLCCSLVTPETQDQPDNTINRPTSSLSSPETVPVSSMSSCYCLPISASCPVSYIGLHLATCAGLTCCPVPPKPTTTPYPETCHCVPETLCPKPSNITKANTFCKAPYTLCCGSSTQTVLQPSSSTINFPTPTPVSLPPNRDCRCVTTASECPANGDILYGSDVIDIRLEITCPSLVCCTPPPRPAAVASPPQNNACVCLNRISECPIHYNIIPQFVGPQCGPPRVFCCPPDNKAPTFTTTSTTPVAPYEPWTQTAPVQPSWTQEPWIENFQEKPSDPVSWTQRPPIYQHEEPWTEQPPTQAPAQQSSPGPWCHCSSSSVCGTLRVGGELARNVCGEGMVLCCETPNSTTPLPMQPLTKCRFPQEPAFPAEGSCSCATKTHCLQPAQFSITTQGQCPAPLGWCCRSLDYCGATTQVRAPWLVAVEEAHDRSVLCSALVVHRIAVLVPTSCVAGQTAQSLIVRVIQRGFRESTELNECGARVAAVIQSREFSLLLMKNVPLAPEPPFNPSCPPPRPAENVDPGDCVLSAVTSARNTSIARVSVATSLQPSSTCGARNDQVCVGARRLQFRGDCSSAWRRGAVVLCRIRGGGDRLALMAVVTHDDGTGTGVCGGFSMRATAARGPWLSETLAYLDVLQPSASWPAPSEENLLYKDLRRGKQV